MSSVLSRRVTTVALCALLGLAGMSSGRILVHEADGGTDLATRVAKLTAVDALARQGTFTFTSVEPYDQHRQAVHQALEDMGFRPAWQGHYGEGVASAWYSEALDMTMVCTEQATDSGHTHQAYVMSGKLSRHGYVLW